MSTTTHQLSAKERAGYSLGDLASNLMWMFFIFYIQFFYTDVFGLTPADIATMFLVVRLMDSATDPIMGIIADRTETKWGKFRPFILWFAIPFGVIGWLTLTTPDWSYGAKLAYAYVTYSLMMIVYTAVNIPYSALMGVITNDISERTKVSSWRFIGAYSGGLIVQATAMILVVFYGGGIAGDIENETFGYSMTGLTYGLLAALLFLVTFASTKERVKPPKKQETNLKSDLKDLVTNGPWLILFLIGIATLSYVSIRNGAIVYYFKYYTAEKAFFMESLNWHFDLGSAFMIVGTLGTLVSLTFTGWITRMLGGKKSAYIILVALTTLFTLVFYILPPEATGWMFFFQVIANFLFGPTAALVWAMYADTADYSEHKTGRRATGLVFSAATSAQKLGWTVGGSMSMLLMSYYGYTANDVSIEAVGGIKMLISVIPAAGSAIACLLMIIYPLNDKRMSAIQEDLEARRSDD
jgi:glycoside/pentoside/hexuronide:cation symporter, GPH family